MNECAGRAEGGVILINAEAFKVHHPECFHHGLGATRFVKVVIGDGADRSTIADVGVKLTKALIGVWEAPLLSSVFGHNNLAWVKAFEGGEEVFWVHL